MITIVDYNTGNIKSVTNAFSRLGAESRLTSNPIEIMTADKLFLPGVGEMATAMDKLRERGLIEAIKSRSNPTLGVCLGMQLMCEYSEEGNTNGMGIFDNKVLHIKGDDRLKVPHVGWNSIYNLKSGLFEGVEEDDFVYYVHSYSANINENTIATTDYPLPFSGALNRANFYGCQFHPEKSGVLGAKILSNFLKL